MANLNIAIQIAAQDKASGPIGKIRQSVAGLANSTREGFSGLQTIIGSGLVAGAGVAVGAIGLIGTAAFGVANDVQAATGDMQAQFGLTRDEAENAANIAAEVWGNNFAGSIGEAGQAIGLIRQQLGDLSNEELQRTAENAFRLSDAFGTEVPESIDAAKTLMENFGLSSDEAFDFIAAGYQKGLDRSGDFLDSIGEYSTQFANGGANADQFFSLMESGLQGGVLGTDKAADAFKEFRVRIQDGSTATSEALEAIGIDSDALAEQMADGSITAADSFQMVIDALNDVEDENVRMQAGVGLLGTQFEDLGQAGALNLSLIGTSMEDLEGSTSSLDAQYNTLGDAVEGFKRKGLLALRPIGDILLDLGNRVLPIVDRGFAFFETTVVPAIETGAGVIQSFIGNLEEGMSPLNAFIEAVWDLAPQGVLDFLIQLRDDILPGLAAWFTDNVQPIIDMVTNFVSWQDVLIAVGVVIGATVIPALVSIVAAAAPVIAIGALLVGAIALVRTAWENDWGGIQGKVATATEFIRSTIVTVITGVQTFWINHGETILTNAQTVWEAIQGVIETVTTIISSVMAAWQSAREGDWTAFGENLRAAWDTAWQAISGVLDKAKTFLTEKVQNIIDNIRIRFTGTDWGELGRSIITGLLNALADGAAQIAAKVAEIAQNAWDAWTGFWDSSSPSRRAYGGAQDVLDGYAGGFEDDSAIQRAINSLSANIFEPLTRPVLPPSSAQTAVSAGVAGGTQLVFHIDARGAAPGTATNMEKAVEAVLRRQGIKADARRRI